MSPVIPMAGDFEPRRHVLIEECTVALAEAHQHAGIAFGLSVARMSVVRPGPNQTARNHGGAATVRPKPGRPFDVFGRCVVADLPPEGRVALRADHVSPLFSTAPLPVGAAWPCAK